MLSLNFRITSLARSSSKVLKRVDTSIKRNTAIQSPGSEPDSEMEKCNCACSIARSFVLVFTGGSGRVGFLSGGGRKQLNSNPIKS